MERLWILYNTWEAMCADARAIGNLGKPNGDA